MKYIIDVQGFQINGQFIAKELSVISMNGEIKSLIIRPPIPWDSLSPKSKAVNSWVQRNHHGIPWDAGK